MSYQTFKSGVLGHVIGDGQCVSLIVNNASAYCEQLWPGVSWPNIISPVTGARELLGAAHAQYFDVIQNDHNDPNQLPQPGDVMVFDATPQAGYSNTYYNPYGHTGICDSADGTGFTLLQQNSPYNGAAANLTHYTWKFRPCLGWLRPKVASPAPAPAPSGNVGKDLYLPPTTGPWHLYNPDGPYVPTAAKGILVPSQYGGLHYTIVADKGNGVFVINTQMFGQGALWTQGSDVVVS